ncbi:hypothetical protein Aperf_G00000052337 [Anoplocephala perfoliata]
MMYSFESRYKSRRQPPYVVGQTNIVLKMQEERRARALNARLEKAATTIQAAYRGFKARQKMNILFLQEFQQLSNELLAPSTDAETDPNYIKSVQSCLSAFVLISKRDYMNSNTPTAAKILLTSACKSIFVQSLAQNGSNLTSAIKQIIFRFLYYLKSLPPSTPSDQYALVLEVLDNYLFKLRSRYHAQMVPIAEFDKFFIDVCKRGCYFASMTIFIDRQSRFPTDSSPSALDEYIRMSENRSFIYFIRSPFLLCSSSKDPGNGISPLQEVVSIALKDVTEVDEQREKRAAASIATTTTDPCRILRFIFPLIGISIPFDVLVNYLYVCAGGSSSEPTIPEKTRLKPSLNLLLMLLSGPIPRYLRERNFNSGADDSELLLRVSRILSWMFSALVAARCPADGSTTVFSPPFPPEPLDGPHSTQTRVATFDRIGTESQDESEESDSDETEDVDMDSAQEPKIQGSDRASELAQEELERFTDSLPGQTREVFNLLEKLFPTLAAAVLQGAYGNNSLLSKQEVLNSLPILYGMLVFYRPPALTVLRTLTSSVSEPPQFLHDLWELVTSINVENGSGSKNIFESIVQKTIQDIPKEMDIFTSVLLTFLASLHYRLRRLTDEEVDTTPSIPDSLNSYGFTPKNLLSVGLRLRDFLLGVIDLLYPERSPLRAKPDGSYVPVSLGEVIARVERQRMSDQSSTFDDTKEDEAVRLRWCLHRWRTIFLATQRVIRLIYAWQRRRRRLQFQDWAIATSDPSNQEAEPGREWLCPSFMASELAQPRTAEWIVNFCGDLKARKCTSAELGFFSCLNPDTDTKPSAAGSFLTWRKWTLILELPFIFPFWDRVKLFVLIVRFYRQKYQYPSSPLYGLIMSRGNSFNLKVHRNRIYEDVFMALAGKPAETFLTRFNVTFYNEAGTMEMGIDGGGLSREMIVAVLSQGFDPLRGLFRYNDDHALYPNPDAESLMEDFEAHYIFLGAILAKAIYEGMLVDLQFAPFFLAKIISANRNLNVDFNYLRSLDAELYRQLCRLKSYEGDVRDLELDFTIVQCLYGKNTIVDLKPNGSSIPVTNESRVEYINLVANYKLNTQIQRQSMAFLSGMTGVLDLKWLQLFDAEELQIVISGTDNEIDVDDWQQNTKYVGGISVSRLDVALYYPHLYGGLRLGRFMILGNNSIDITGEQESNALRLFWAFVRELNDEQKRKLIRFVTASSRPPMFGFAYLHPEFTIQIISDTSHLPTSSTCSNLLKLPAYKSAEEMREKFLLAIESNAGFEFS